MKHSITFTDIYSEPEWDTSGRRFIRGVNTWDDWHLIPTSRPEIAPPEVYTNYVDLPGATGKLDLSEYLTGGPCYKNRSGSFDFYVENGYGLWIDRYNEMTAFIHGKRLYMALLDEPEYYYKGRFKLEKYSSDGRSNWSTVTISYDLEPYKWPVNGSGGGIL